MLRQNLDMDADRQLTDELLLGASLPLPDLSRGRDRLMAEVRRCRTSREERPAMRFSLSRKSFAFAAAGLLAVGAIGTVGTSGGVSDVAGNVGDVLAALNVTDRTPDVADEHIDAIEQPDGAPDGAGSSGLDEHANDNASEGADNADDGINNSSASETGLDNAADNASEGSGNADAEHGSGDLPDPADGALEEVDPGPPADSPAEEHTDLPEQAGDPPVPFD